MQSPPPARHAAASVEADIARHESRRTWVSADPVLARIAIEQCLQPLLGGVFLGLGDEGKLPGGQHMPEQAARIGGLLGEDVLRQGNHGQLVRLRRRDQPCPDRLRIELQYPSRVAEIMAGDVP